ncbi:recombinase [Streptococcus chenjunshii]|uniref:Recombinase n=1 Tax=Streptococcus chenjunshii TaxID=2173853 RepID=A0A372KKG4_9STRE|nr:SP_0009 family protein [Streptococcus chenjunshii]AXQ77615.1 recombinase [Streptococcus chenjunshii]RFU50274.1 recombinase [Streptococcus chenjunshii]RFU52486.1 recombinase [Streptococcus chenjunshii]
MEDLVETIEKFLIYSDDKLEELSEKNQTLREESVLKSIERKS